MKTRRIDRDLVVGDEVVIQVPRENREWGYDPAPDGVRAVVTDAGNGFWVTVAVDGRPLSGSIGAHCLLLVDRKDEVEQLERDAALAEVERFKSDANDAPAVARLFASVNDAIQRAGVYGMLTFAEGIDQIARERDDARAARDHVSMQIGEPVPMLLWCPECGERHVDEGAFASKSHHTHACQHCGHVWRPAIGATCGMQFLPGFK